MEQITDRVVMIRPKHFGYNEETAANNVFQSVDPGVPAAEVSEKAIEEFEKIVELLRSHDVHVDVIEDTATPAKPDAVFPNNWFSMHGDGTVITYPMYSLKRRFERREDILKELSEKYEVRKRYAFEQYEEENQFLEGTGSMVLDRVNKVLYACLSERTDIRVLDKFCLLMGYRKVVFHAESMEQPVYHTNVVMALGESFVVICLECIFEESQRKELLDSFSQTGKEVIKITDKQMHSFAGNMLQLKNADDERICVMSEQAFRSLSADQLTRLQKHNKLIFSQLDIIEKFGGGSARCMIAENFLPGN